MKLFDKFKRKPKVDLTNPLIVEVRYKNQVYPITDTLLKFRKVFRWISFIVYATCIILFFALPKDLWVINICIFATWSGVMILYAIFLLIILKKLFKIKKENENRSKNNE